MTDEIKKEILGRYVKGNYYKWERLDVKKICDDIDFIEESNKNRLN